MKISELPQEIKEKALYRQKNEVSTHFDKSTDNLRKAFYWENLEYSFWNELDKQPSPKKEAKDKNLVEVIEKYNSRAELGFKKYGVTTERKDIDLLGWLNHLQDELMDATIYIQRLKNETRDQNIQKTS